MRHIDFSQPRMTSVTIRSEIRNRLQRAVEALKCRGIHFSEQRLMRECLRYALRLWRGRGKISSRNTRYNKRSGHYEIVPFCTTEALRRVARARCHHSGISLSRLMDFAITNYLPRVTEYWLRFEYRHRDPLDVEIWRAKFSRRRLPGDFIISYEADTKENNGSTLNYAERSQIEPWPPDWAAS